MLNYKNISPGDPEQSDGTVEKMDGLFLVEVGKFTELKIGLKETVRYIKDKI